MPSSFPIIAVGALFLALSLLASTHVSAQQAGAPSTASDISVTVDVSEVNSLTGQSFSFTSTVANAGTAATPPLIANLSFVSLDQGTYIDPEDWSSHRAVTIDPIPPGGAATQSWTVTPVLNGSIAAYVVVMPSVPSLAIDAPVVASPAIHLLVGEHRQLNPGGVLPIVTLVPLLLAGAFGGIWIRRRRQ